MIKFGMTASDGSNILGIGLDAENIERLQQGKPILFNLSDIGLALVKNPIERPGKVFIVFGETLENIKDEVYAQFGKPKRVIDSRGSPRKKRD